MPIFEYVCKQCNNSFEALVRASTTVECPSCKSTSLEKQLSIFSSGKGELTTSPVNGDPFACGTCGDPRGPGACSLDYALRHLRG